MKVVKQPLCVAHWIGGLLGWVLESTALLYAVVCPSEGTQNSRYLSKARPMTATARGKDSSIYISTEYEGFVKHLLWSGGLLGWVYSLNHFTMLWFAPLEVPRILDNFQKLGQWQQQYVNMIHPYAHPQHMKDVKHLSCVGRGCVNQSMWVWSLNQCTRASFSTKQWPRILVDLPNLHRQICWYNGMMMDPYPHPQHMKVVKQLSYVWSGCGNHSMWVWSLNHCTRASFSAKQWPRISADFQNPDLQVWL